MLLLWMSCSLTLICSFDSKLQLGRLYLVLIVCQLYDGGERNNDEVCQRTVLVLRCLLLDGNGK